MPSNTLLLSRNVLEGELTYEIGREAARMTVSARP